MNEEISPAPKILGPRSGADLLFWAAELTSPLSTRLSNVPPWMKAPTEAFIANLYSTHAIGHLPAEVVLAGIDRKRFEQILTAERIRTLRPDTKPDEERALSIAKEKYELERKSEHFHEWSNRELVYAFTQISDKQAAFAGLRELLRQLLVMSWSAFETLSRDIVIGACNHDPRKAIRLLQSPSLKRDLPNRDDLVEALAAGNFDLRDKMGDVLFSGRRLDALPLMQGILSELFPDAQTLFALLKDERLWHLYQRRHLIVHRRGRIDPAYIKLTRDTQTIGDVLWVSVDEARDALILVRDVGLKLLDAAADSAFVEPA